MAFIVENYYRYNTRIVVPEEIDLSGIGSVSSFASGNLSPLFTTLVTNPTSAPALSFDLTDAAPNTVFAGPASGGSGDPSYRSLVASDLPGSVVLTSGSYSDPSWITSLAWSKITGTPTTRAGYGITDAQATLVSAVNIKTINGTSLLGSGDIIITGGSGTVTSVDVSGGSTGLTFSSGPITVSGTITMAGKLAYASLADGSALSLLGRSANSSGVNASIAAGSDFQILRRSGTSIAFGSIDLSQSAAVGSSVLGSSNGGAGAINGILKANGSGVVSAATAGTDYLAPAAAYLVASGGTASGANLFIGSSTNTFTFRAASLGTTAAQFMVLENNTAAAAGAQQISPDLVFKGQGWKTNATAASQSVEYRTRVIPTQGTSAPIGQYSIYSSIAAGAETEVLRITSGGQLYAPQGTIGAPSGANLNIHVNGATFINAFPSAAVRYFHANGHVFSTATAAITSGSVLVDFQSTTLGVIMPRVTNIASVTTPVAGMIAYDAATNKFNFRENTSWIQLGGSGITNTAAANELGMSNGTNIIPSGLFASGATGDIQLGTSLTGSQRTITAAGSATDINIAFTPKGAAGVVVGSGPITSGSVLMDLQSTSRALLLSKVTNSAAVTTPVSGMIAWDSSAAAFLVRLASNWDYILTGADTQIITNKRITFLAGTSSASSAPIKLVSGTNMTTPENGAIEYDGTNYFVTSGSTRYTVDKVLTNTAALNFPSTAAQTNSDLTITVTGASVGDVVNLGVPATAVMNNSCYTAWVSATNTVTVRFNNYDIINASDPPSATFRVSVVKY